ncbi:MAG TPA: hypothetical protein V6C85_33305 [Allocoleopsis sp.]
MSVEPLNLAQVSKTSVCEHTIFLLIVHLLAPEEKCLGKYLQFDRYQ